MYLFPFCRMTSMENDTEKINNPRTCNEVTCNKHFTDRYKNTQQESEV